MYGLGLDFFGPGQLVSLRAGDSLREQLLDVLGDDRAVFRVNHRHGAELLARVEDGVQVDVGQHECVVHEAFERVDAVLVAERGHFPEGPVRPLRHDHVQPVVAADLRVRLLPVLVVLLHERLALLRQNEVD